MSGGNLSFNLKMFPPFKPKNSLGKSKGKLYKPSGTYLHAEGKYCENVLKEERCSTAEDVRMMWEIGPWDLVSEERRERYSGVGWRGFIIVRPEGVIWAKEFKGVLTFTMPRG